MRGRAGRWMAGLVVGGVALALAFRGVPLAELGRVLAGVRPAWLAAMAVLLGAQEVVRALRQRALVHAAGGRIGLLDSVEVIFVSYLFVHLLPARLGEVVRPAMLRGRAGLPLPTAVGLVVVERAADLVAVLLVLGLVLAGAPEGAALDWGGGRLHLGTLLHGFALAVVLPALVAIVALARAGPAAAAGIRRAGERLGGRAERAATAVAEGVERFAAGLATVRRGRGLGALAAWTAAVWTVTGTIYLACAHALDMAELVGALEAAGVMVITVLASILPAPPGMAGVQEASGRAALALFGIAGPELDARALAYAVLVHWWQVVVQAVVAAFFLHRAGTGLRPPPSVIKGNGPSREQGSSLSTGVE